MKVFVVQEYSLEYEFISRDWKDDEDVIQTIEYVGIANVFESREAAEKWIAEQEIEWDGQYVIEEERLR